LENDVEESLPQGETGSTENAVQPPMMKRKYNRQELPPPCKGRGGAQHEAFSRSMKHFQQNLNKKKN